LRAQRPATTGNAAVFQYYTHASPRQHTDMNLSAPAATELDLR